MPTNPLLELYPHPGKYEGEMNLTEKLDSEMSPNDDFGDVDTFGHYQLFTDLHKDEELGDLGGIQAAILETGSQGFVTGTYFNNADDAERAWEKLKAEYHKFMDVEEEEEPEQETMYRVRFAAHSGIAFYISDYPVDLPEARQHAAKYLRHLRRHGQIIDVLNKGQEWEAIDPDGAVMCSDMTGILWIHKGKY